MNQVIIGRLGRPHGVQGEMGLHDVSLSPQEMERVRRFTWRGRRGETRALTLRSARATHERMLVAFEEALDRDQAAELTLGELLASPDQLPDPGPQAAYTFQLIGLVVETVDGRALGTLADIVTTGAHPIYVVRGERELLIPAVPEFLKRLDLAAGRIVVALPAGLEEL